MQRGPGGPGGRRDGALGEHWDGGMVLKPYAHSLTHLDVFCCLSIEEGCLAVLEEQCGYSLAEACGREQQPQRSH